ncbi:MAG: AMP-binding protein [Sphingomonadales bacterium]|nr:AMP-binding protein [Sphingomonadales bacterium]
MGAKSARLAAYWRGKGIGKGDRVLLAMPVGIDLYAAIAGLWRLGAVIVFPEPALGINGLRHALHIARPKAVLTSGIYRILNIIIPGLWRVKHKLRLREKPGADICEQVESGHPALISFTSGSTGHPKAIVRSHGFLMAQNDCIGQMLASDNDNEIDLVAFPVFVIANLGSGVTSVLPDWKLSRHDRADAAAITRLIARERISRALVPPSICEILTKGGQDPGLNAIFTGGGPIFPDLMRRMMTVMPNTAIMAVYGSTEAEPIAHLMVADISADDWASMENGGGLLAGPPVPETSVQIIADEIVVTGGHVNKGYLDGIGDAENKVMMDGVIWHRTGDAGRFDEHGRLWLLGRWSAKAGGYFPFALEVAARSWDGVIAAALIPGSQPVTLALSGREPRSGYWQEKAAALGDIIVMAMAEIPVDRRHRSKIDYAALKQALKSK